MDGRGAKEAAGDAARASPVPAIGAPAERVAQVAGEDQDESASSGDPPHRLVARAPLRTGGGVVAEDDPRAARQARQSLLKSGVGALVGHQPECRHGLAGGHGATYRAAMAEPETSPAAQRLADVRTALGRAAGLAGRRPEDVDLVAISKTHPAGAILPLLEAGQRGFGENRVQEAAAKWPALRQSYPDVRLHLVGQLQSNKARDAVALFDAIHSVDRPSLVTALAAAMADEGRRPDCYVQVNIGAEQQKGGCAIGDLPALLKQARAAGLPVVGLMAVPPATLEPAPYFALLGELAGRHDIQGLSMGMSGDYETAAMLGSTCVRVGTALFGVR
jgi:pyridoxal phosphate enzyme (YggS family)